MTMERAEKNLHEKIVREILPRFAEKLKTEKIISAYDCQPFTIPLIEGEPPITIVPDLVLYLPNGEKVLIEVANPRDPKRFLGEIVSPHFLFYLKKITKCILYVLHSLEKQNIHDRGFHQNMMLEQFFKSQGQVIMASWSKNEDNAYHNLKYIIQSNFFGWAIKEDKPKRSNNIEQ